MAFPSGDVLSISIDKHKFVSSVHGGRLNCQDCHAGYTKLPHPTRQLQSKRDYSLAQYETCKRCHFANYTKTLDSIHFQVLGEGNRVAPVCTDCHGAHDVTSPDQPRARIARTCSTCHKQVYDTFVGSVHGKALVDENNQDVPTCTYCHGVHNIVDPRVPTFRHTIPQLCGQCHTNKALMDKYGLSTDVVQTYLRDFHGVTVSLTAKQNPDILTYEAVCTDCHGIHDIVSTKSVSQDVLKANLLATCQKCHPGAGPNFPNAWLSHYEPSPSHNPAVYYVKLFYRIFIPFTIGGLSLHVLLNLWRATINR